MLTLSLISVMYLFCAQNRQWSACTLFHITCGFTTKNGQPYEPNFMTIALNRYFNLSNVDILVIKTKMVSDESHSKRSVLSRSYMYGLAVTKDALPSYTDCLQFAPIEERNRCYYIP